MKVHYHTISRKTTHVMEWVDITEDVVNEVKKSGITNGVVNVYTQHTTCAIKINEYEEKLVKDMSAFLEKMVPMSGEYGHDRDPVDGRKNAHSHLKSLILNSSESIPIQGGKALLGGWQRVFFVELDGPREKRNVIIQVMGE